MNNNTAYLNNDNKFTSFIYNNRVIRFATPKSLERYTRIKKWDNGYIVVDAKYKHNEVPEEEYIDLVPILQNLYIDSREFLSPIKKVELKYD
ncbi:MAG: hypothetical protein HUJ63_07140 [Enterococcus sp.]|nr:hypothetical protein [Enterococcus sp.]